MSIPYRMNYVPLVVRDMEAMRAFDRATVVNAIQRHLSHEPSRVSKSSIKKMKQPFWSQFRLRVDEFRAYYDVEEAERHVIVLRVTRKGTGTTPEESP